MEDKTKCKVCKGYAPNGEYCGCQESVTMWKCSVCGTNLTYIDEDAEPQHHTHFDVTRSNKALEIEDGNIEETDANLKMERQFCEDCFNKILWESKTLRKTLEMDGQVIY